MFVGPPLMSENGGFAGGDVECCEGGDGLLVRWVGSPKKQMIQL